MSQARPVWRAGERGRGGEELEHVATVDRLRAVRRATPAARARAGARSAARGSGTSASGRRSRSRRAARPTPGAASSSALLDRSRDARWRDGAPSDGQQAAEVDDPPHAGGGRRARERLGLAALEVDEGCRADPPSSGSGSRRRRRRRARASSPAPVVASPSTRSSSCDPAASTRSRERAKPRTACPSRTSRGTSAAPT